MTNKTREEFEAWYINDGYGDRRPTRHLEGYAAPNVNDMWLSWQSSRAALCVELPSGYIGHPCRNDILSAVDECRIALDDAGVSYK